MESEEIKALRREQKNATIKSSIKATKARHALMIPVPVELKLDLKCLSKAERQRLEGYFVEARWLRNYLLALPPDEFRAFDTSTRDIHSLDRNGNSVPRHLEMPAKFLQSVYKSVRNDMRSLAKKKEKTGRKNGSLKFCSQYRSIDLNQYGNTHWICYGDEYDISVRETERLKGLQKKLARQARHSKGWYDTKRMIQREHEKIASRRKDAANKTFRAITEGKDVLVIQDDNIKGWHKGLFGKEVQNSCLGTLKAKFKADPRTIVIGRFFPSTAVCPICGHKHEGMELGVDDFVCPSCGYTEKRDKKAAITTLLAGEIEHASTHVGRMRTPVELTSGFQRFYEAWKQSASKPETAIPLG